MAEKIGMILGLLFICWIFSLVIDESIDREKLPCSEFSSYTTRNLPVRCLSYYNNPISTTTEIRIP